MTEHRAETEALSFYLTQRLTRRDVPATSAGFDALFGCQYMGSSEFEWGAIPEAYKRLRSVKKLSLHIGEVTRDKTTAPVFVVGEAKRIERVPAALTEWMADSYPRGKEMTYFPEHVTRTVKDWQRDTHAWWSISADVMWALDIDTAERLLKGVRG